MKNISHLPIEKRERIIKAGLEVFSQEGYLNASTNKIVKIAGISKGSLFHYFGSKKGFYYYLIEYVNDMLLSYMKGFSLKSNEWRDTLLRFSAIEYDFHRENPLIMAFYKKLIQDLNLEIHKNIYDQLHMKSEMIFNNILETFDFSQEKQLHIYFVVNGYNEWFYNEYYNNDELVDANRMKNKYIKGLEKHLKMIGGK